MLLTNIPKNMTTECINPQLPVPTTEVQPSVEQLYEIANHLDVDVKDLLVSSKELI